MSDSKSIAHLIREKKTLLIIIAVVLFMLEMEIFAIAVIKSGPKSWLQVLNRNGNVIHETVGNSLSEFDRDYFESIFGPFEQYEVKLVTKERPFPFRAWFAAALGIPVGVVLLFGFVVKAYASLFYESEKERYMQHEPEDKSKNKNETRIEKIIGRISRFNIFIIGFLVFLSVFLYWVLPNFITYLGKTGIDALIRYKVVFITVTSVIAAFIGWIIYLRYLLAKRAIDSQVEINKYRLRLESDQHDQRHKKQTIQLEHFPGSKVIKPLVALDESDEYIKTE